jgi:hypothetical protein
MNEKEDKEGASDGGIQMEVNFSYNGDILVMIVQSRTILPTK